MEKKAAKKKTQSRKPEVKPESPSREIKTPRLRKKADVQPQAQAFGLHNLKRPKGAMQGKRILGRGPSSGHGRTSTRGSKGQTSRAGRDFYPGFEGGQTPLIRRIAKRGFTNRFKKEYQIIDLGDLADIKEANITIDLLMEKGLIKNKACPVKILGDGELKNAFNISVHAFSKAASEKILKAGGKIEKINVC